MSNDSSVRPRNRNMMAMMAALILLTAVPAVVHGVWSRRWDNTQELAVSAQKLEDLPRQFGNWKAQGDDEAMPEEAIRELQCAGYFNRRYVNQKLGRDVTVMLMVGPSGPLIRHPPEICYGNRANKLLQDPTDIGITTSDSRRHTFRLLRYKNPSSVSGEFSVCYGWSDDGTWSVPSSPRVRFGGAPLLYKIQVLTADAAPADDKLPAATAEFLAEFLPLFCDSH